MKADMPGRKFPCKDCESRKPGCHGKCERYSRTVDFIRREHKWEYAEKYDSLDYEYRLKIR